jgi:hypothetical protein
LEMVFEEGAEEVAKINSQRGRMQLFFYDED